jgi:hypothetical protein
VQRCNCAPPAQQAYAPQQQMPMQQDREMRKLPLQNQKPGDYASAELQK